MRILYVLTSLGIGGAEKQVVALAERMSAKGHSVAFLVLKHAQEEWPVKLPVLRLNLAKTPLSVVRGIRFARNFIHLYRPEILHSHTFPANLFTRIASIGVRINGIAPTTINTIHNMHEGGLHRILAYALTSPLVDRVTAVSTAAAERFVRLRAVSKNKIVVITNGIDTDEFAPDQKRRKITRIQMKAASSFVWLAAGRLAPAKDYPNLVQAFQALQQTQPDTQLWIAGEGDPTTLFASQPHLLRAADLPQWLGLRRDIPALLDAADGFVLSSAWEGMPLVVGEAMSMGKPVVATHVGGVSELMGDTGLLVPPGDSSALMQAMLVVMNEHKMLRKRAAIAARERIIAHFSINSRAEQWEAYYQESLAGSGRE